MDGFVDTLVAFVRAHESWGPPIVLMLAFGESLAFISLLLPATVILLGIGALVGASGVAFWPLWASAVIGAFLGDWVSYWIGRKFKGRIARVWPLSRHPDLLRRGRSFFERWGAIGVFIGRFSGPLRASVPIAAGICGMPFVPFQIANVLSALVWATGILAPSAFGLRWLQGWF